MGVDFNELLKSVISNNATNISELPQDAQSVAEDIEITGSAGGGAVQVIINGKFECVRCFVDWDSIDQNKEIATNLIAVAFTMAARDLIAKIMNNPVLIGSIMQKMLLQ